MTFDSLGLSFGFSFSLVTYALSRRLTGGSLMRIVLRCIWGMEPWWIFLFLFFIARSVYGVYHCEYMVIPCTLTLFKVITMYST